MMNQRSITLKAYHCPRTGRDIHFSFAHLRGSGQQSSSSDAAPKINILKSNESNEDDTTIIGAKSACWIFFYPAGPNRRVLETVISRYATKFQSERDVFFLCLNRPGKGGTSSSGTTSSDDEVDTSPEQEYIRTACSDVISIIDYYQVPKVSLLYMCAGSTFAFSFAKLHTDRTTDSILGISSWILRHDGSCSDGSVDCATPSNMNSKLHSWAMQGYLGSKSFISTLAGGCVGSSPRLFSILPQQWILDGFKKELSGSERLEFDQQYPGEAGLEFVEMMTWMYQDKNGDGSVFVNATKFEESYDNRIPCMNDGNAMDIAVCLSTQLDVDLEYKSSLPKQMRVLLWHGENDSMVNLTGAEYLRSMLTNATLSYVPNGTHQGTMIFFPRDLMLELNRTSNALTQM